jgi:TBC1 domain family member 6
MAGLITDIDVMVELLESRVPEVKRHLEEMGKWKIVKCYSNNPYSHPQSGLPWAVIVTKWFICAYAEVLPVETVLRIWDCLFAEGIKILFRVAISIFVRNRQEIVEITDISDMATYFRTLHKQNKLIDCHQFMHSIFVVPGNLRTRQIDRLRREISARRNQKNKQV